MKLKEKEITCPWCHEKTLPTQDRVQKPYAAVVEAKCSRCGNLLAAYKEGEGDFLLNIRVF